MPKKIKKCKQYKRRNPSDGLLFKSSPGKFPSEEAVRLMLLDKFMENKIGDFFPSVKDETGKVLFITKTADDDTRIKRLAETAYATVYKTFAPPPRHVYSMAKIVYAKYTKKREELLKKTREEKINKELEFGYTPILRKARKNPRKKRKTKKRI